MLLEGGSWCTAKSGSGTGSRACWECNGPIPTQVTLYTEPLYTQTINDFYIDSEDGETDAQCLMNCAVDCLCLVYIYKNVEIH